VLLDFRTNRGFDVSLPKVRLLHATAIAFLVAYGELAIGLALVSGVLVRLAGLFGLVYMLTLLFSSNYPGPEARFWQYFGASLDHSVLALCFLTFLIARADSTWSAQPWLRNRQKA
jgi:thiosulfate dehydrogenase (quinone) large subunit